MFNGMLHPLAGYTVKGFLWNQGESNVGREKEYVERFKTMTRLWRKMWRQGDDPLPMYTVELPGYSYGDVNGTNAADFRAAQHQIAHELENSGCVSTTDLILPYEAEQIHGCRKKEIGQRLAYMAATRDYGIEGIQDRPWLPMPTTRERSCASISAISSMVSIGCSTSKALRQLALTAFGTRPSFGPKTGGATPNTEDAS